MMTRNDKNEIVLTDRKHYQLCNEDGKHFVASRVVQTTLHRNGNSTCYAEIHAVSDLFDNEDAANAAYDEIFDSTCV